MRFPRLRIASLLAIFIVLPLSQVVWGQDSLSSNTSTIPKIIAVQQRPYQLKNEISLSASYLPLDHFNTYLTVGGAYTHFFNDYIGWEVVNGATAFDSSTGLEGFLKSKFQALPDTPDVLQWHATSNIIYTPIYMKNLFMNQEIVWGDISFVGGYGTSRYKIAGSVGTIDLGVIFRYMKSESSSIKFDLRQYFYLAGGLKPNLAIGFVYSYNFSDFERKPPQEIEE